MYRALMVLVVIGVLSTSARAQSPGLLPIQGVLADSEGMPLSGAVDLTFRLYDAEAATDPIFEELQSLVADGGHFTAYLGDVETLDLSIFRDNETIYVGLQVGDDEEMMPRALLGSVPWSGFALYCSDAGTVGGMAPTDFADVGHTHSFSELTDVPAGLDDGDSDTLALLSCADDQLAVSNGGVWGCADAPAPAWASLTGIPGGFADGTDDDTTYSAGTGINIGAGAISLDTTYTDGRYLMSTYAPQWSALTGVPAGFSDNVDNDTTYAAGTGLSLASGTFTLDTGYTDSRYWGLGGNAGTDPSTDYVGTSDAAGFELRANGQRGLRLDWITNGTMNVVLGSNANAASATAVATIGGGGIGSAPNVVTDDYGVVAGGAGNRAGDDTGNSGTSPGPTVSGGLRNIANNSYSTVGGGFGNAANGQRSTIAGGRSNAANGDDTTVSGGSNNTTNGWANTIGGGTGNSTDGLNSFQGATVGGGQNNTAAHAWSTVAGGNNNNASLQAAFIGGGERNAAAGAWSVISGGVDNSTTVQESVIGGGTRNAANARWTSVLGGVDNTASSTYASVMGGSTNTASGIYSAVLGGRSNLASGSYSVAAGRRAQASSSGCFVFGDSTDADVACGGNNRFVSRASGGYYLYTNAGLSTGASMGAGSGTWSSLSDRNAKEDFEPVDGERILQQVVELPISTWRYREEVSRAKHVGPMAQDFHEAFGLGDDERHITSVDADGIALAAIQGLAAKVRRLEAQQESNGSAALRHLRQENAQLRNELEGLEARLARLEGAGEGTSPVIEGAGLQWKAPLAVLLGLALLVLGLRARRWTQVAA